MVSGNTPEQNRDMIQALVRCYEKRGEKVTEEELCERFKLDYDEVFGKDKAEPIANTKLVTTHSVPGREIQQALGIVSAECVLGINVFRDMLGGLRDFIGGRSGTHQKALREARETCLRELAQEAGALGADAVVGVDLDYSEISGGGKGMVLLVASGTAVRLR